MRQCKNNITIIIQEQGIQREREGERESKRQELNGDRDDDDGEI